jgi:hypothetical protein
VTAPSLIVATTEMFKIYSGFTVRGLLERITKSANLPTYSEPFVLSSLICHAPFIVIPLRAS